MIPFAVQRMLFRWFPWAKGSGYYRPVANLYSRSAVHGVEICERRGGGVYFIRQQRNGKSEFENIPGLYGPYRDEDAAERAAVQAGFLNE